MPVNVTYLLGAGASYDIVPLVKEVRNSNNKVIKESIGNDILRFVEKFKELRKHLDPKQNGINELIESLKVLGDQCNFFSSPDTYLRSLYLQNKNNPEIDNLKLVFSFYLSLTQLFHYQIIDKRYIPFFASILENQEGKLQIPDHINIITWNYDFQLELALQFFDKSLDDLNKTQNKFNIIPSGNNIVLPKIIHLNGIGGFYKSGLDSGFFPSKKTNFKEDNAQLEEALYDFNELKRSAKVLDNLTFAWELRDTNNQRVKAARKIFKATDTLVIVGYSFPFFNRIIDRELFSAFKLNGNKKIYIQDPNINDGRISFLREQFNFDTNLVSIIPVSSVEQFFIPPEL